MSNTMGVQISNTQNADCSPTTIKELSQNQLPKVIRNFEYSSFNRFKDRIRPLAGKWVFDESLWHLLVEWGITVVTFPRWKCFLSYTSLTASSYEWGKEKETTWTQGQSVRKDIWRSYFLMFLPSFSYLLFKSTHTPSTHSSLWEELHILTAYCMQTHFWFLLLHFGHWLATLLPYSLNIISWRLFTNTVGNLCPIWRGCCGISFIHKEPFQTSSNS